MSSSVSKKLYHGTITVPVVVYAEDENKATDAVRSLAAVSPGLADAVVELTPVEDLSDIPEDQHLDRPVGSEKMTISEIVYMQNKVFVKSVTVGSK